MEHIHSPLLVIGGGNMGRAIVEGAVRGGVLLGSRVVVSEPDPAKHAAFEAVGAACVTAAPEALALLSSLEDVHGPGVILLSVKPQMLTAVAQAVGSAPRHQVQPERLILSILAGMTTSRVAGAIKGRIVRLMPNTPAQIGLGMTAMCAGPGASEQDLDTTRRVFQAVGRVVDLPEDLLDAFTGVAGSGPAYIFYLAEGMVAGAEAVGFSRDQAMELVRATIAGAAGLLEAAPDAEPSRLRAMVTSKGGTTAAATAVMDDRAMRDAVRDAIVAARDRGRELASM